MAHIASRRIAAPILRAAYKKGGRTPAAVTHDLRQAFAGKNIPACVVEEWLNEPRRRAYVRQKRDGFGRRKQQHRKGWVQKMRDKRYAQRMARKIARMHANPIQIAVIVRKIVKRMFSRKFK